MNVQPGATFEAVAKFPTGLVGTLGVRIIDNAGATTVARVTAGIAEYPAGSGIYTKTLAAPATGGQYTLAWDDGDDHWAIEDLVVTFSAPAALGGDLYITPDELKATLELSDTEYADDDVVMACAAASRGIDGALGQRFYTDTTDRYFSPGRFDKYIDLGPTGSISSVTVDTNGDGTYDQTWAEGIDFYLDPPNAAAQGLPYTRLQLRRQAGRVFPWYYERGVKVSGTFGWVDIPPEVRQYAKLFAAKLLVRARQAPFGFQTIAGDVAGIARIAKTDPDFQALIGHLVRKKLFV